MLKSKKAFTLIEIIVAFAVAGILFVFISAMFAIVSNLSGSVINLSQVQNFTQQTLWDIEAAVRYSDSLTISDGLPEPLADSYTYIYLENGELKKVSKNSPATSLSSEKDKNYKYNISFIKKSLGILEVKLSVLKKGEIVHEADLTIAIQNLNSDSIKGLDSGSHIAYRLPDKSSIRVSYITIYSPYDNIISPSPIQLRAEAYPYNASDKSIVWLIDDPELAEISSSGVLTPLKNGIVTVTAAAADGSDTKAIKQIIISGIK